jgi:hypothetical protein
MTIWEAYNQEETHSVQFFNQADANAYAYVHNYLVRSRDIEGSLLEATAWSIQLKEDLKFGQFLIEEFLKDNRLLPISFTPESSLLIFQKFSDVEALCRLGDIKSVRLLLIGKEVDQIFTQERKNKYIQMCDEHLVYQNLI